MKHFGHKVHYKDWDFDSRKERDFFIRFIEDSGKRFDVHKSFRLVDKFPLGGYNHRGLTYSPDFVVYGSDGSIEHVYDVKSGINQKAVDTAAKIRFTLFSLKTGLPVEVVVPRVHNFKMKLFGFTNSQIQTAHAHYDRKGNIKRRKNGEPVYDHYDVYHSIDYDLKDIIGN